jgi:hypothetical protein
VSQIGIEADGLSSVIERSTTSYERTHVREFRWWSGEQQGAQAMSGPLWCRPSSDFLAADVSVGIANVAANLAGCSRPRRSQ